MSTNETVSAPAKIKIVKNQAMIPMSKSHLMAKNNQFVRKLSEKDEKELEMFLGLLSPIEPVKFTISIISNNQEMGIANRVLGQVVKTLQSKSDNTNVSEVDAINLLPSVSDVIQELNNCFISEKEQYYPIPVKGYTLGQEYDFSIELGGRSTGAAKSTVGCNPFNNIPIVLFLSESETVGSSKSEIKKKNQEQEAMMKLLLEEEDKKDKKKQGKKKK